MHEARTMEKDIHDALRWRYGVKVFEKGKKVPQETLDAIVDAAVMAPAAYGLQPFRLIHVKDEALRTAVRAAGFDQSKITDAGDLFVIARRTDIDDAFIDAFVAHTAAVRGLKIEDLQGFSSVMKGDILSRSESDKAAWAGRQAYIAFGMMLETAALLGVDAGPMEGFIPAQVDAALSLAERNLASVGMVTIGYRDSSDSYAALPKVRIAREDLVIVQ